MHGGLVFTPFAHTIIAERGSGRGGESSRAATQHHSRVYASSQISPTGNLYA